MATTIQKILTLLDRQTPAMGVVVSYSGGKANIATSTGMVQADIGNQVGIGMRVRVANGVAVPSALVQPTKIYSV